VPSRAPTRFRRVLRIRVLRVAGRLLLALVLVAAGYVGYVWWRHDRPVSLVAPSGRHPVGRRTVTWTDRGRTDRLAPHRGPRRLSVWLWYPAARGAGGSGPPAPYAPGAWRQLHLPAPVGIGETRFAKVRTHSRSNAPVAAGRFPVVVLEPGLGFAAPQYQSLAEDLASHGYLVAGVTPTYSANLTVLDGRVVRSDQAGNPSGFDGGRSRAALATSRRLLAVWVADARFAAREVARLDRRGPFAGHVADGRTLYLGHSFGGAAALQACAEDRGCDGAVDLDGGGYGSVTRTGLRAPLMLVGHDNSCVTGTCNPEATGDRPDRRVARRLLDRSRGPAWTVTLAESAHFSFTDYADYYLAAPLRFLVPLGSVDGRAGLRLTAGYLAAFADRATTGHGSGLLQPGRHRVGSATATVTGVRPGRTPEQRAHAAG
jgi:dienelactone hydrolase